VILLTERGVVVCKKYNPFEPLHSPR